MFLKIFEDKGFVDLLNLREIKEIHPIEVDMILEQLLKKLMKAEKKLIASIMNIVRKVFRRHLAPSKK
jgi:hypothetical protein